MSVYYPSFNYLGKNSNDTMGLIVSHLDNSDSGETETFLSMDPIYTDNYLGTRRIDYGARYNSVAVLNITVIKQDSGNFSVQEIRDCLKWLTGVQSNSNLDLVIDGDVKYSFTGRFTNASHYKMDARTIGLVLEFTSISPWAYSAPKVIEQSILSDETIQIDCDTDDLYSYVYMKTVFSNTAGESVVIENRTTNDKTEITNLKTNEIVTLDNNMTITSDDNKRVFGNDFNFTFPRLQAGVNEINIVGNGDVRFEYIVPIKLGDVAMDINAYSAPICDDSGEIVLDTLPWSRVSETPDTIIEYGITDAYTKAEVDAKIDNVAVKSIAWDNITHAPTTLEGYGIEKKYYSAAEVDTLLSSALSTLNEDELNAMLTEVLD